MIGQCKFLLWNATPSPLRTRLRKLAFSPSGWPGTKVSVCSGDSGNCPLSIDKDQVSIDLATEN